MLCFCLICDSVLEVFFHGYLCILPCRCCVLVSVVHSVAILSAVFCAICSLLILVSDASGDHMVESFEYGYCILRV